MRRFLVYTLLVLRNFRGINRWRVLSSYKALVFLRKSSFLGYSITCFTKKTLRTLIEEIFLRQEYAFEAERDNPLVIDCGSNIGVSVLFFKHLYPKAHIIAFEPDPEAFALLEENIMSNNLRDVTAHNAALSDREGTGMLYGDANEPGSLTASVTKKDASSQKKEVSAVLLSNYISGPVDFLKMDIEGAEGTVLAELARAGKLPLIREMIIEFHGAKENPANSLPRTLSLLEDAGFRYVVSSAHKKPPYGRYKHKPFTLLVYAYRDA